MDKKNSFPEYFLRRVLLMSMSFIFCFFSAIALQAFLKKQNIHEIVGNTLFFYGYDQNHFYFLFLCLFFFIWALCFFYPRARFEPIWKQVKQWQPCNQPTETWSLSTKILCFIFFTGLLLGLTYPALHYGLAWDDLHLIRPYSIAELLSTFTGNWDVDGVENPGYRPFMTIWHALLYFLFDEDFMYYRILSALLIAFTYVLIIDLGRHFVPRIKWILIGLVLAAFSHTQSLYVGWVTESFRALQLLCAVGSLWALHRGLLYKKNLFIFILFAFLFHTVGIFAREENTLLIIPIATLIYWTLRKNNAPRFQYWSLIGLFVLPILFYWRLRYVFVPASTYYYNFVPWGPVATFHATMSHYPFWGLPLYIFGATLCLSVQPLNRFFLFCFGMGIISCATSFSGLARPDTSFYPVLWLGLAGGIGLSTMQEGSQKQKWLGCAFILLITVNGINGNWQRMRSLNEMATYIIAGNSTFLYGESDGSKAKRNYGRGPSNTVSIPPDRYKVYTQKYRQLGYKGGDPKQWIESLEEQADKAKRFSPNPQHLPFKSHVNFFYYR